MGTFNDQNCSSNSQRSDLFLLCRIYRDLTARDDEQLRHLQLGRLHHQLLLGISCHPGETVSYHLAILKITKQSISRLIRDLLERALVEERPGSRDRRQRLLFVTATGADLERRLTEAQSRRLARLYEEAGLEGMERFRELMRTLLDPLGQVYPMRDSCVGVDRAAVGEIPSRT